MSSNDLLLSLGVQVGVCEVEQPGVLGLSEAVGQGLTVAHVP